MKTAGLAINVVRINHGNKVLRFRAWYTVTEKMSVIIDTSTLGERNTTALILWSLRSPILQRPWKKMQNTEVRP